MIMVKGQRLIRRKVVADYRQELQGETGLNYIGLQTFINFRSD